MSEVPYNFRDEAVHLVPAPHMVDIWNTEGPLILKFQCRRCERTLPQECFGIVKRELAADFISKDASFIALHSWCWTCREQVKGKWIGHPDYSPGMDRYFGKMIHKIRAGAKARSLACLIDKDDVLGLFFEQEQRCAITGVKMEWKAGTGGKQGRARRNTPSVDRINSGGNYSLGNIQLVLSVVNCMKNDMSMPVFVEICRRITAYADRALESNRAV